MGTHPSFSGAGPSAAYTPKSTDESDGSIVGAYVVHTNPQVAGSPVSATNRLPADTVAQATSASRSGTITAGGTAQVLMAANTARRGFVLQNQSSGALYVNTLATATADQNSLLIPAGGYYETPVHHVGTGAVSIIGATTGAAFYSREF